MESQAINTKLDLLSGSLLHLGPEIALVAGLLSMLVAELVAGKRIRLLVPATGLLFLIAASVITLLQWGSWENGSQTGQDPFLNMIRPDHYASFFRLLFYASGIVALIVAVYSKRLRDQSPPGGEFYLLLFGTLIGMSFLGMARNLLLIYLALELVSLPSYILTVYTRLNRKSAEASLKYVIYGGFSSAMMLYGISWLYGISGTLDPLDPAFANALTGLAPVSQVLILLMVLGGFVYKISAIPFHFWTPDVYEAAPYPVAAFLSVGPKAAGFAVLIRLLSMLPLDQDTILSDNLKLILGLMALGSMTLGNLAALRQDNFRRMLAYSSIAHSGYLLMGVLAFGVNGWSAVLFYLCVYYAMNFASFLIAGWLEEFRGVERIDDMRGLGSNLPLLAFLTTLFMLALTGLPPTAGFIAKLEIFLAVLNDYSNQNGSWLLMLLVIAVLNTVISLFYYLRVPVMMIFRNPAVKSVSRLQGPVPVIALILAIPVLLLGIVGFDRLITFLQGLFLNFPG